MADGRTVNVPGLGMLPARFTRTFDGINISGGSDPRRHNEGDYELNCQKNWILKDRFTITGADKKDHYRFDLDFDAWSSCMLWGEGMVSLFYHKPSRSWRIQTSKPDGARWEACNPDAVIDRIAGAETKNGQFAVRGALECFKLSEDASSLGITNAITAVIAGLRVGKDQIAAQMPRYTRNSDCDPVEQIDIYKDLNVNPYGP